MRSDDRRLPSEDTMWPIPTQKHSENAAREVVGKQSTPQSCAASSFVVQWSNSASSDWADRGVDPTLAKSTYGILDKTCMQCVTQENTSENGKSKTSQPQILLCSLYKRTMSSVAGVIAHSTRQPRTLSRNDEEILPIVLQDMGSWRVSTVVERLEQERLDRKKDTHRRVGRSMAQRQSSRRLTAKHHAWFPENILPKRRCSNGYHAQPTERGSDLSIEADQSYRKRTTKPT